MECEAPPRVYAADAGPNKATLHSKGIFVARVNTWCKTALEEWNKGEPPDEEALDARMGTTADVFWEEIQNCLPMKKPKKQEPASKHARSLRQTVRYLRALVSEVDGLLAGHIGTYDRGLHAAALNLGTIGLGVEGWRTFSLPEWSDWGAAALTVLPHAERELAPSGSRA